MWRICTGLFVIIYKYCAAVQADSELSLRIYRRFSGLLADHNQYHITSSLVQRFIISVMTVFQVHMLCEDDNIIIFKI